LVGGLLLGAGDKTTPKSLIFKRDFRFDILLAQDNWLIVDAEKLILVRKLNEQPVVVSKRTIILLK
jgi:hypothetical protein